MTFDFEKILESKLATRRKLASLPVAEKLKMLDDLRERAVAIRNATVQGESGAVVVREESLPYRESTDL
ncbi:MAG: hypothetical protein WC655_12670 [Candidatus Hydrogenedentales bacterium]